MSIRVLVVDDDPAIRNLLDLSLSLEGMEITSAEDGVAGFQAAQQLHPDVILLDVMMPGMSGIEVLKRIRQDSELGDSRVILLTAKAADADAWAGWCSGADSYVTKPFDIEEVSSEIFRVTAPEMEEADATW